MKFHRKNNGSNLIAVIMIMILTAWTSAIGDSNPFGLSYPYQIGELSFPRDDGIHKSESWLGPGSFESWTFSGHVMTEENVRFEIFLQYTALNFPWFNPTGGIFDPDLPDMFTINITNLETSERIYQYQGPSIETMEAWETMLWLEWGDNYFHAGTAPFTYQIKVGNEEETAELQLDLTSRQYPLPFGWTGFLALRNDVNGHEYMHTDLLGIGSLKLNGQDFFISGNFTMAHQWYEADLDVILDWAINYHYHDRFEIILSDGTAIVLWIVYPPNDEPYIPAVNMLTADGTIIYYHERMCDPDDRPEVTAIGSARGRLSENYYRHGWHIALPLDELILECYPQLTDQECSASMGLTDISFWQGAIKVLGKHAGQTIQGEGNVQIYARLGDDISPTPPEDIELMAGNGWISLEWNPSLDSSVAGYKVYWGESPRIYSNFVDTQLLTRFNIKNLVNGKRYYLAISAYASSGSESTYSKEVSIVPTDGMPALTLMLTTQYPHAGETFRIVAKVENPGPGHPADLYAVIELAGEFYFYPTWTSTVNYEPVYVDQTQTTYLEILSIRLPYSLSQEVAFNIHAGLTYPDSAELLGFPDSIEISLQP